MAEMGDMSRPGADHRVRLLLAMATVVAAKGYAATTIADVVAEAGVSKRTFYEHFNGKQECLLACYEQAVAILIAALREGRSGGSGRPGVERVIDSYLSVLDHSPAITTALLNEIDAAGAEGRRVRREGNLQLARLLLEVVPEGEAPEFDLDQALAMVGGLTEMVLSHGERHPEQPFATLRPSVLRFVSAVLAGSGAGQYPTPA